MEARLLLPLCFLIIATFPANSYGHVLHSRRLHRYRKPSSLSLAAPSASSAASSGPDIFFEVSRPTGGSSSPCSALIIQHAFAYTYDLPPAVANYTPPSYCSTPWDQIVLKWSGTCKGRQYDRIAAVWFGGVEVLRTCTAEPTSTGIYWEVRKDVTRFTSVFMEPQLVVLELANVVDSTYTGIFNINLTLEFYSSKHHESHDVDPGHTSHHDGYGVQDAWSATSHDAKRFDPFIQPSVGSRLSAHTTSFDIDVNILPKHDVGRVRTMHPHDGDAESMYSHDVQCRNGNCADDGLHRHSLPLDFTDSFHRDALLMDSTDDGLRKGTFHMDSANIAPSLDFPTDSPADLIIPIAKADGLSGGHWFDIETENDTASVSFSPPRNIFRAVLEICVSFHGTDEFWYTNPPNDYLEANGLTGYPGNGPFREVQVFLDDVRVGAVWPFPVIFTGGINPLYWRPAAAIGAYNLPSYDVELTPFVGSLVDGGEHTISMSVKNADGSWPLDANLHLWLDPYTSQTMGGLLSHDTPTASLNTASDFEGLDGTFHTSAGRMITFSGYIISSLGTLLASVSYTYAFDNVLIYQNSSSVQIITQETQTKGEVIIKSPSKIVFSQEITSVYPFYLSASDYSGANGMYTEECNLTHAFNQDVFTVSPAICTFESLKNSQAAEGSMTVVGSSVTAGTAALQQHYDFQSTGGCYDRVLHTQNYTTLCDITDMSCELYRADS